MASCLWPVAGNLGRLRTSEQQEPDRNGGLAPVACPWGWDGRCERSRVGLAAA